MKQDCPSLRKYTRLACEGCADDPADWCIAVGDMADYVVETDRGHYVTRDEVYDILRQAEDNGFVHQITNIDVTKRKINGNRNPPTFHLA